MKPIEIAGVCHEANREMTRLLKDVPIQAAWEDCGEDMRASALVGVEWRIKHPDAPASAAHEVWMKERMDKGWVHGEKRDNDKKTHPALVPYDKLPLGVQLKDKVFVAIILALRDTPDAVEKDPKSEVDEEFEAVRMEKFPCGHGVRVDLHLEVLQDLKASHGLDARKEMLDAIQYERLRHQEGLCAGGEPESRIESREIDGVTHFYLMTGDAISRELTPPPHK